MADANISDDSISTDTQPEASPGQSADKVLEIGPHDKLSIAWGAVISQKSGARLEQFEAIEAQHVLLFVNRGKLHVKVDEQTLTAFKGQTLLLWPDEKCVGVDPHKADLRCQWLSFGVKHSRRRATQDIIQVPRITDVSDPGMVGELFRMLTEEYHKYQSKKALGVPLSSQGAQHLLLSLLSRLNPTQSEEPQPSNAPTVLAERARDYLRANHAKVSSITELAKMLDCSVGYLRTAFRCTYSYSPMAYLLDLRMHEARYLLSSSRLTINDIAQQCGYTDPGYFARVFAREHGVPPTQYRIAHSRQHVTPGI